MSTNFFLENFNAIAFSIWVLFYLIVVLRFSRPNLVKNISYVWLVVTAVSLHLLYGIFATWGQYVVWSKNEFTKILLSSPLSRDVPFPLFLEWTRPLFDSTNGYFAFYSFQHFFLSTLALLFITGIFVLFFRVYAWYRPTRFKEGDMLIIALAFLIAGYMGSIILVPIAFIIAILFAFFDVFISNKSLAILAPSFLLATPLAFVLATPILKALEYYIVLKL